MAPLGPRIDEPQPVDDIVEPPLECDQKVCARDTLLAIRPHEKQFELFFRKTEHFFYFLLLSELYAVIRYFSAATLTVFSGGIAAAVKRTFIGIAPIAFEIEF
jgi:hypothetical protein